MSEHVQEQYNKALHLADVIWRSETDGALDPKRLKQLQERYIISVWAEALEHAERAQEDQKVETRALESALTALLHDERVHAMMDPEYVHVVTCNASRDAPVGNEGCSCPIGKRIALLRTRLAEAEQALDKRWELAEQASHYRTRAEAAEGQWHASAEILTTQAIGLCRLNDDVARLKAQLAEAEQRGRQIEAALADMIDVADRCAWYVVRATRTTPYEDRIRAARAMLTPGALSAPPPGDKA